LHANRRSLTEHPNRGGHAPPKHPYFPPSMAIIAPNPQWASAPSPFMMALTSQTSSSQPAELTVRATSAETMKIPEPIIEPATMAPASTNPSSRRNVPSYATTAVSARSVILKDLVPRCDLNQDVIRVTYVHRAGLGCAVQRVRNVFLL